MAKSTDSKDREAECEKCKKLIDMLFGPEKPDIILKQVPANVDDVHIDTIKKVGAKQNEKNALESVDESIKVNTVDQTAMRLDNILQSTTAKSTEEQLAQRLETIEEPGLVEAATPKVDGFNTNPKMLGDRENIFERKKFLYTKIRPEEVTMDEIAKKCLGTPHDKIDERILEEMKSCGMLGRGRKKSSLKKSGYNSIKSKEKEVLLETKSEQKTLYYTNQHIPGSSLPISPRMGYPYNNISLAHNSKKIHSAYFKNIPLPLHLVGDGHQETKTEGQKITTIEQSIENAAPEDVKTIQQQDKTLLVSSENNMVESYMKNPIIKDQMCPKTEVSKEYLTESTNQEERTTEEEKHKELTKDEEVEVEKIRVTATESSRLGLPGETEVDPDFDHKNTRSEILPYNISRIYKATLKENCNKSDTRGYVAFSDTKNPGDWNLRPDFADRQFNAPNTAISSTYPPSAHSPPQPEASQNDTSISSKQNPSEYFDLSHCKIVNVKDDYVISLSEIRSLAAYHQYTIITGTGEAEESKNMFSKKVSPEVSSLNLESTPQIEKHDSFKTINKDVSEPMGPLPQLKDIEEELSLTEMLRRVRERNRLQYCRECALEAEPVEANKNPCDKGSAKTLRPKPCKPKPKPACPPPPPPCPPPCPPGKPKDPCAKFTKSIIADKIKETFTLVLQVAFKPDLTLSSDTFINKMNAVEPLNGVFNNNDVYRIEKLGNFFLSNCPESTKTRFWQDDVILARDYEPWTPIPSWPMSKKKEEKKPFVCPKEGCKEDPPPYIEAPCKEDKPCNLPKRTFSLMEFAYEPLPLYLYDNEF